MKLYLPFLLLFGIAGCYPYNEIPVATKTTVNNRTYKVDYLFEHEGCKVYRFSDYGNLVYFTNCNGEAIAKTDSTQTRNIIKREAN